MKILSLYKQDGSEATYAGYCRTPMDINSKYTGFPECTGECHEILTHAKMGNSELIEIKPRLVIEKDVQPFILNKIFE